MEPARTVFCIPIFDDWKSAEVLLQRLDSVVKENGLVARVLLVDDCSNAAAPATIAGPYEALERVDVLRLRRNLGHQRAIAVGLTHIYEEGGADHVVVMDGDGEDAPEDVPKLLAALAAAPDHAVFAKRARRSESMTFRVFYQTYRAAHRVLTGRKVEVGNFSVVPIAVIARLVAVAEMWNHFAAAVFIARVPIVTVPIARGTRIAGRSQMNFVSLAVHGLSAVSVYAEIIGVRLLLASVAMIVACFGGLAVIGVLSLQPGFVLPPWTPHVAVALLVLVFNALLLAIVFVFVTLQGRNTATFLPLRDWRFYVENVRTVTETRGD